MTAEQAWEQYHDDPVVAPILLHYIKVTAELDNLKKGLRSTANMAAIIEVSQDQIQLREKLVRHIGRKDRLAQKARWSKFQWIVLAILGSAALIHGLRLMNIF